MPITYKCPGCGAAMEFDSASQTLLCTACGNKIPVPEYERLYGRETYDANAGGRGNVNAANMKIYHCSNCGAELVADEYTSATFCSFCGNPSLVQDRLTGEFGPQTVIPFKINKEQAIDIYRKWCKKGWLTPSSLSKTSTIEKISGIYVPFWLYNYSAGTTMYANAEKVRTTRRGNTEYIYTDHFQVYRDVSAEFERIPADASEKMPDDTMDKLEPYNYRELVDFEMPYLSGYLSERYNYTPDQIQSRATTRANQYITDIARSTIRGYSTVTVVQNNIRMQATGDEYALFPVWMLNYKFNGKDYQFALNGQTGKIVADRPISKIKAVLFGTGIGAVTFVITMIGGLFFL